MRCVMVLWRALLAAFLVGCAGDPAGDGPDTDDTAVDTQDTDDTDDTDDTVPGAPATPGVPEARATGTTTVQVLWSDASDDETVFRVERDGGVGFAEVGTAGEDASSFDDDALTPGATYSYRVRACRDDVCSASSAEAEVTLPEVKALPAPDQLVVVPFDASEIDLSWDDNATDETAYVVAWSDDQGLTFEEYPDLPANTQFATDSGLLDGTTYCYRVRAKNAVSTSAWSETRCATTFANAVPGAPQGLGAALLGDGRILLTWTNPDTNTGYKVYESVNGGGFVFAGQVTPGNLAGTYVDGLSLSTSYAYKVAATNAFGDSVQSTASNTVTTTAPTTTRLVVSNQSVYPIVSLRIDGVEQFPASPQGIPPGGAYALPVAAGSHSYAAENGFWSGGARSTLYTWSGSASVTSGQTATVTLDDPTLPQLLTHFAASGAYVGEYWSGTVLNWKRLRFFANGTYTLENNGVQVGTGSVSLLAYNGNYLVSFRLTGAGGGDALLDERTGTFYLRNGPTDWPTIQYGYDGP